MKPTKQLHQVIYF